MHNIEALGRQQILLAGIETHVCVYQTAADLLARGFEVQIVADAVSSRRAFDKTVGLDRARTLGARIACVEMVLFELMRTAEHPAFKSVLKIVR
jgi:nicotinamidase-related amidase